MRELKEKGHPPRKTRSARTLRLLLRLLLALGVSLILAELGVRFLLFSEVPAVVRRTQRLRQAKNFADRAFDENYWKLLYTFKGESRVRENPNYDASLGWVRTDVSPGSYEHRARAKLGGRRPLLVYGDSFANCVTGPNNCWEGLMERSPLAAEWAVINYGTGGYGFDQIVMLLARTLELYRSENPVVVLSLLVESDLERSLLACRDWPKPRFYLDDQGLLQTPAPVPPSEELFLRENPLQIPSYLLNYLVHGSGLASLGFKDWYLGLDDRVAEAIALNRALLTHAIAELEASGLEYFVLLFGGAKSYGAARRTAWEEAFLLEELERLQVPVLLTRPLIRRAALEQSVAESHYYILQGKGLNHLNAEGNAVVFEAFERGLRADYDDPLDLRILDWESLQWTGEPGRLLWLRSESGEQRTRLQCDLEAGAAVKLGYTLAGKALRLHATLGVVGSGTGELRCLLDGKPVWTRAIEAAAPEEPIEVDLSRGGRLDLQLRNQGPTPISLTLYAARIEGGWAADPSVPR